MLSINRSLHCCRSEGARLWDDTSSCGPASWPHAVRAGADGRDPISSASRSGSPGGGVKRLVWRRMNSGKAVDGVDYDLHATMLSPGRRSRGKLSLAGTCGDRCAWRRDSRNPCLTWRARCRLLRWKTDSPVQAAEVGTAQTPPSCAAPWTCDRMALIFKPGVPITASSPGATCVPRRSCATARRFP